MRIIPTAPIEDDRFDSLDIIAQAEEVKEKRRSAGKQRVAVVTADIESALQAQDAVKANQLGNRIKPKRKKYDTKTRKTKDTQRISLFATVQQFTVREYLELFLLDKTSRRLGAPFLALGLFFCGILEVIQPSFRYNFIIFLVLAMASMFPAFPENSVRPQLCVSVATLLSFAFDIVKLSNKFKTESGIITIVVFQMICKLLVFHAFLRNTKGGSRTRKYLDRRLRLFFIPLRQPKRIMRDVRGRFLALVWLQLFAVMAYSLFLVCFVAYFDYAILLLSRQSSASLPIFLLFKTITSLLVLGGLLYDTDIRLALFYFGCFGFYVDYIRKYIARRRIELEGWPLAFSYYGLRFYVLCIVKIIDVMWGFYGWYLVGSNYFQGFLRIESSLQIFLTFLVYTLIVTDVWCPVLFMGIRWLLKRHKKMREMKVEYVSDDSEIEEFHLREDLQPLLEEDKTKEERRVQRVLDNLAALEEAEQDKLSLLRKPSRADMIRIKGLKPNKSLKRGAIMPINVMEKALEDIEPEDVLDNPDDDYDHKRLVKTRDSNPMHPSSSHSSESERSGGAVTPYQSPPKKKSNVDSEFVDTTFATKKDGSRPIKQISPMEFSELWDIFAVKEVSKELFVMLSLSKHFQSCAELSDIREYTKSPPPMQRATLLRALISHLQYEHVNVISAGMYNEGAEISILCYRLATRNNKPKNQNNESETVLVLIELKLIPIEFYMQRKVDRKQTAEVVPFNTDFAVECIFRANSLEHSKLGMRFIDLDRLFSLL